jgi:hypothetical protein
MVRRPATAALVAGLAATLLASVQSAPTADAAVRRPDLVVGALTGAAQVQAGTTLRVSVTTVNRGRGPAAATTTRVYLSRDTRVGRDVAVAAVRVPQLPAGRRSSTIVRLPIPATVAVRSYRLLACADALRRVREVREGNNCRLAIRSVRVTAADPDVPDFPLVPDPVSATSIEEEPGRAVTRLLDPEVPASLGPITATASDGTTYSLVVPAKALLSAEQITLTPIADADLPLLSNGFIAGVRLEPEGLLLQAPARLTIKSPDAGPLAQQTAYVFHEEGEDFHHYPPAVPAAGDGPNTVRLELAHFSVAGVGGGTDADRAALAAHPPVRDVAQAAATVAEILRQARESGGDSGPALDQARGVLEAYYWDVVDGDLAAAETDASLAAGATAEAIALLAQLERLGSVDSPIHDKVKARLRTIWANAIEHYWQRCTQQHDLRAVGTLVGIARQAALIGWLDLSAKAWDYAQRCSHYEVEFTSLMGHSRNHFPGNGSSVRSTAQLQLESSTTVPALGAGVSELAFTQAALWERVEAEGSWVEDNLVGTKPGSVRVDVLERSNPIDAGPGGPPPALPVPYVRVDPGVGADGVEDPPQERLLRTTNLAGYEPTEYDTTFWHSTLIAFFDEFYPVRIEADLKQTAGSEILLDESWDHTFGSDSTIIGMYTGHTTLKVTHTPQS